MPDNKYSAFTDYFNNPVNQSEAVKTQTVIDTRVSQEVFKDSAKYPATKYPVAKISKTIALPLSGTIGSKYEPIGKDEMTFKTLNPFYEKTTADISTEEMDFYNEMFATEKSAFLASKMKDHILALSKHVNNMQNMALTGIVTSYYRGNEGQILGHPEYNVASDRGVYSQSEFGIDFSVDGTTRMDVFNAMETVRIARNKAIGGMYLQPTDIVTFVHPTQFAFLAEILDTRMSDNNISKINASDLNLLGYRFINSSIPYATYEKNATTGIWEETQTTVLSSKQMLMVDVVNGQNKFRFLKVGTTDGSADNMDYSMILVEKEDKSGWTIWFRAKPIPIVNGESLTLVSTDA